MIHLPAGRGARVPVGHRVERRGAGRLDHHGARAHGGGDRGAATGRAPEPLPASGTRAAQDLHLLPTLVDGRPNPEAEPPGRRGAPRCAAPSRGRPRRRFFTPAARRGDRAAPGRRRCSRPSPSSSAARRATRPATPASTPGCASRPPTSAPGSAPSSTSGPRRSPTPISTCSGSTASSPGSRWAWPPTTPGWCPPFKEAVEACFTEGLTKAVFATETLALGVNMPARSVVIERLTKFCGERRELLTPGEYTQLTGRAGRRGIDEVGYAIVLWSPFVPFEQVAALASSRTYALRSAFRPTYNMAANLVRRYAARAGAPPPQPLVRPVPGRQGRRAAGSAHRAPARAAGPPARRRRAASAATSRSTGACGPRPASGRVAGRTATGGGVRSERTPP